MKWQNRDRKLTKRHKNRKQDKFFKEKSKKDSDQKISFSRLQRELRRVDIEESYEDI